MIILVMRMMVETADRGNENDGVATAESDCNGFHRHLQRPVGSSW